MTVLDILASTEIHSLPRGCAFSYRLILWGYGGAYHKDSKYLCSSFAVKAGGGLTFEGGVFSGEYGIWSTSKGLVHVYE